jgi:hypothetical protein
VTGKIQTPKESRREVEERCISEECNQVQSGLLKTEINFKSPADYKVLEVRSDSSLIDSKGEAWRVINT